MGPKVYLVDRDHDNLCVGPWQPRFLAPLWTTQTQSMLNLQKVLVNSANLHEFWFICCYFQILILGEKVGLWRSKECLCPSSTVTLSLDLSLPCNLRELMQGLHLHPSWLPWGKSYLWPGRKARGIGGEGVREKELINGSQILAFDQVVWSEVSSQEMR